MQINLPDAPVNQGFPVFGTPVSKNEFQGVLTHGLFKNLVPDPRRLEGKDAKHHQDLHGVATLRQRVQRLVTGAKGKNVLPYSKYILDMASTGGGFTPQIVLWTLEELRVEVDPTTGLAWALVPHEMKFVALDGDTQTTARWVADGQDPKALNKQSVKVVIKHGTTEEDAAQIFADCNSQGVKVTTSMAIGLDTRDDATQLAKEVERSVAALNGKVNRQKRQLSTGDNDLITISALRASIVCFAEGISGVQNQTKTVEIRESEATVLRDAAVAWYAAVVDALNGALTPAVRSSTFASAPSVWCALGALGRETLIDLAGPELSKATTPSGLDHAFRALAKSKVESIDWTRNEKWLGVGAKRTSAGAITLGGPKETGSLVFKGIKDGVLNRKDLLAAAA